MIMKQYDLIIVVGSPFPEGGVMVNRIMSYALELLARGKKILVLPKHRTQFYGENNIVQSSGCYKGIDYEYIMPAWRKKIPSKFRRAILDRIVRVWRMYFLLLFKYRTKSIQYYSRETGDALRLWIITKLTKSGFFREISETPLYHTSKIKRFIDTQYCRLYDGMVVMTEGIREYFSFIPDKKIFILPMSVNLCRFSVAKNTQENYFFYCSGGNLERDGLLDSLRGFLSFHKLYPEYLFKIATNINKELEYDRAVLDIIENNECIKYMGVLPIDNIPYFMVHAMGLLVTPHRDYLTKGFPTKLGEYMASSRPVICSSIDTLKKHIPDDCALFVNPNSPDEIKRQLVYIVENKELCDIIGEKGRHLVESKFTVKPYADDLCSFLNVS